MSRAPVPHSGSRQPPDGQVIVSRSIPRHLFPVALALVALALPGCCGNDKIPEDDQVEKLSPIVSGSTEVKSPRIAWEYLVEAVDPQFEPPVIHPDTGADKTPGRPPRVWHLLASSLRDRIGSFKAFRDAWPALRPKLLEIFEPTRRPKDETPGETDDENGGDGDEPADRSAGATDTLTLVSDDDRPAITLHFVYEYDPSRNVNEPGPVWRLQVTGLEAVFADLLADETDDDGEPDDEDGEGPGNDSGTVSDGESAGSGRD
jgi:hypothetical protein